ncbi:MAG: hypothetical protein OHK0011_01610 [Turneriella sp.]
MRRRRGGAFLFLLPLALFAACAVGEPLPQDYYSGTDKIAGGQAPSVPVVTYTPASRRFDFTASIDPETGNEVGNYIVYYYTGVPSKYYEQRYIGAIIPAGSARTFFFSDSAGTYTVIVTGYDGFRESAVTDANRITFTLP